MNNEEMNCDEWKASNLPGKFVGPEHKLTAEECDAIDWLGEQDTETLRWLSKTPSDQIPFDLREIQKYFQSNFLLPEDQEKLPSGLTPAEVCAKVVEWKAEKIRNMSDDELLDKMWKADSNYDFARYLDEWKRRKQS